MAIQVDGTKIRHNGKVFNSGETIEKIKANDAKRLVDAGHAFFVENDSQSSSEDKNPEGNK